MASTFPSPKPVSSPALRFSGHETFACRYAWLPKAAQAVDQFPDILTAAKEEDAMVELGLGKNMVRSTRFWAEAADIVEPFEGKHRVTDFGRDLLCGSGETEGHDPYLEDIQTLWLLHWKLATNSKSLIFAWNFLLNQFHEPELHLSSATRAFEKALPGRKDWQLQYVGDPVVDFLPFGGPMGHRLSAV